MKILVLPGDGIGSEITEATVAVLTAADKRSASGSCSSATRSDLRP